jgi:5-methylthioadenosine/S-adenosylhomocysteine deaminase
VSSILIKGALIIPAEHAGSGSFYGDIRIKGDIIESIVKFPDSISAQHADRVIEAGNLIVMPGFVNTHGHAAMTLFRSYADDIPLKEWLEQKIWPIEEMLKSDDIYWGTMLAIAEMIKSGTTTFTDMYFFMDRVAEAAAESGIRAVLSRGLVGLGEGGDEGLKETEALIGRWHGAESGRINITIGPHAPYTCPPEFLNKVMTLADRTKRPLHIHLSESKPEVEESLKEYGKTPPRLLYDLGFLDYEVTAAHCVHLTDEDIDLLAEKKVGVAHNPTSNLKLGSGIAPVNKLLDKGINVGIGTDGASSNNNLDMVEEMRLTALLSKGVMMNPTLINAATALHMATAAGAKVLALDGVGTLKEGWKADLIAFRSDRLHMTPLHDPMANIVYSSAASDIDLVIVDGKVLLEKGKLVTLDEERIMFEAAECAKRLVTAGKDKL